MPPSTKKGDQGFGPLMLEVLDILSQLSPSRVLSGCS